MCKHMTSPEPLIVLENLTHIYRQGEAEGRAALRDVTLSIASGEFVAGQRFREINIGTSLKCIAAPNKGKVYH